MEKKITHFTRRRFLHSTAAAAALSLINYAFDKTDDPSVIIKPNSNINGVQIGAITYSWRSMPGGLDNIIRYCKESGISSIELMGDDIEMSLGAPKNPRALFGSSQTRPGERPGSENSRPSERPKTTGTDTQKPPAVSSGPKTPLDQQAAYAQYNEQIKAWRTSVPISKFEEARKKFNDAGIYIHIVKYSPSRWSDEEIDYTFKAAKALGAKGVCEEINETAVKKLAPFAEKHGLYAIFHNHMQFASPGFGYEPFLAVSPSVMINFDAGHYFGSTGLHPNTIIEKYHDRIVSIHIKDKTGPKTEPRNANQVWGQGEMPLSDVLLLIKKQKWPIHCDIELEYEINKWSNAMNEVKNCLNYVRGILL